MNLNIIKLILIFIVFVQCSFAQNKISIADIYSSSKFYQDRVSNIHWKNDGSGIIYRKVVKKRVYRDFFIYDFNSGKNEIFIKGTDINKNEKYDNFVDANVIWSPDEKYILFTGTLAARDVKSGGNFFLYDVKSKEIKPVNNLDSPKLLAQFSPDSKYIGYVKENNLFIVNISTNVEKPLTFDGSDNILNGHFDWVYEEEFDIINGWEWSPDGKHIAFWQVDQGEVPEYQIPEFNSLYPESIIQKYPKAGQKNSKVKIGVVKIKSGKITWFRFNDTDFYIPRIQWLADSNQLAIIKLNRLQNHLGIYLADIKDGSINRIFEEKDKCWIEIKDDLRFLKLSDQYVWTSEQDGYRHIYLNNYEASQNIQVTKGEWEVRKVCGIDEFTQKIYFTATKETELGNHVYSVNFDGSGLIKLSKSKGWHEVNFSPNGKYYLDKYSDIATPIKYSVYNNLGENLTSLEENEMEILESIELGTVEFTEVEVSDNVMLNAWILKPDNFDPDKEYPLMVYTYGGPGSQKVINKWGSISYWFRFLVQNGIIVACIDNRGTEGRGADFKKYVYKKLGQLDVKDQIFAAKYLASLDYIDEDRIGIYGWSYGGYMAPMCLMQGNDVFKLAVSVAPVTDWRYYDTIYTERFMQTPELNKAGYELGSILNYVNLLKGKLLLIHGMADDNVHFQNSAELVTELIRYNKQFDTMFYPGYKHGISGKREHVFTKITNFIFENL